MNDGDLLPKVEAGDGADGEQLLFDFIETEPVSRDLGEALGAAGQVEKPLRVDPPKIAGFEAPLHLVALAKIGPRHRVAQHDIRALVHHSPDGAGGQAARPGRQRSTIGRRASATPTDPAFREKSACCNVVMRGDASVCPYMTKNRPPRRVAQSWIFA